MRAITLFTAALAGLLAASLVRGDDHVDFQLADGDRIALVGDTLIERDQRYGYLETVLTLAHPDKNLVFRNLGWSGDTVAGVSRSGFDPSAAGFEQLRRQIAVVKPTIVILGYGMADSFAGATGVPQFEQGLYRLIDAIAATRARVVLLAPVAHADLGRPLPDPSHHNRELALYRDAIRRVAQQRKAAFVDLFEFFEREYAMIASSSRARPADITDNGIHLTAEGYRALAVLLDKELDGSRALAPRRLILTHDATVVNKQEVSVSKLGATKQGLRFDLIASLLPMPPPSRDGARSDPAGDPASGSCQLSVRGLPAGTYALTVDGSPVATATASAWDHGIVVDRGPELAQVESLRRAINRKNELFFHRWRPQNITYLLGFRKHEQGNNAVEIPQFDPLVSQVEQSISQLKKPVVHAYELARIQSEVAR